MTATLFDVSKDGDQTTFSVRLPDGVQGATVDLLNAKLEEGEEVPIKDVWTVSGIVTVRQEILGVVVRRE